MPAPLEAHRALGDPSPRPFGPPPTCIYIATMLRPAGDTGVQTHFNAFTRWAQQSQVPVRLLTPFDLGPILTYPLFGPGRVARPFSRSLWMWWYRMSHYWALRQRLFRQLHRAIPSVVYAQDPLSARAALEARDGGYPVEVVMIVHFNVSHAFELAAKGDIAPRGRLYHEILSLEREVLCRVDRLIFPSRFVARALEEESPGIAMAPRHYVPNFVFPPASPAPAARLSGDLLSIGTVEPRKNQAFLLHVLSCARSLGHQYRLTIIGEGPLKSDLVALARSLGISDYVTFAGYVPNAASFLSRHAVYVHAARAENHPMAILEALAAGRPVCASAVGGVPEVITNGVEGLYWDLDDPASAARQLIGLLNDSVLYAKMALAARARYARDFAVEVLGPRLCDAVLGRGKEADEALHQA